MRASTKRAILAIIAAGVAVVVCAVITLAVEPLRSGFARGLLSAALSARDFHLRSADLHLGSGQLLVKRLEIDDYASAPFLRADRLRVAYTIHGLHFSITALDLDRADLVLRREADGSFNAQRLSGNQHATPAGTPHGPTAANPPALANLHMRVAMRDGTVDFQNPSAPARPGRALSVEHINLQANLSGGAISTGELNAVLAAPGQPGVPVHALFVENDRSKLATLRASAARVPVAPLLDLFISSPAFIVESGSADLAATAYALGWTQTSGPRWHVVAAGYFRDGRLGVAPLSVPARALAGPLEFMDGVLTLPRVSGEAARLPLAARGSIALVPSPQLDIVVHIGGPLEQARNLLSSSRSMPLRGQLDAVARVNGTPTDPRVGVTLNFPRGLRYGQTPLSGARVRLTYYRNHITLPAVAARYQDFDVWGNGDIDVASQTSPAGQFTLWLRGPSRQIPWIANLDGHGMLYARATMSGQLTKLEGSGFVRLGGPAIDVRTAFEADKDRFIFGPLLALDRRGGSLWLAGSVDRQNPQNGDLHLIAHRFSLALNDRKTALPGVFNRPYGMPAASALIDGTATASGEIEAPQFYVNLKERGLTVAGSRMGDLDVRGLGESGLGWMHVTGIRAQIAGVPLVQADAVIGLGRNQIHVYSARADVAGGRVALTGDVPIRGAPGRRTVIVMVRGIQLGDLRAAGVPIQAGALTALGEVSGSARSPRASLGAVLADGVVAGRRISGDAQLTYDNGRLVLGQSRILLGNGSAVSARGVVGGLSSAASLREARVDIRGSVREGDIQEIAGSSLPPAFPVTGSVDADVQVRGTVTNPAITGNLASSAGTVRGVGYEDLRGSFGVHDGGISISDGHVVIGNSALDAAGSIGANGAAVQLASPRIDLSDFNDFFNGKDVLGGVGSAQMALTTGAAPEANGSFQFRDAQLSDIPLGSLTGKFATNQGTIVARLRQRGAIARSDVRASVALAGGASTSNLANSFYRLSASARDVDVGMLTTFLPAQADGLRGRLNVVASAQGEARNLQGDASFVLRNGFAGKHRINEFSGRVLASNGSVSVEPLNLAFDGINLTANGTYARNGQMSGRAVVRASDLAAAARLAKMPMPLKGSAMLALDASGTVSAPHVHASLNAAPGSAYGIAYKHVGVETVYAPGSVNVKNATIELASRGGTVVASGTAPVTVGPQPIDPLRAPVSRTPLNVVVRSSGLDLAAFNPLLGDRGSLAGKLDFEATASGSLQRPKLGGTAALHDATIKAKLETVPITSLNAAVAFANDTIRLTRLHGTLGKGWVDVNGLARMLPSSRGNGTGPLAYSGHLIAHNANLSVPNFFSGVINANLGIQSGPPFAKIAGSIAASDSNFPFAGILALASGTPSGPPQQSIIPGVPPLRKGHSIWYAGSIYGDKPQEVQPTPLPVKHHISRSMPIALDLTATAGNNVQTTGLVNVTGAGSVHIAGSSTSPTLHGHINMVRGQFGLFDTTFELERGGVAFHPSDGFLPSIDAVAVAYRPEAEVTATVEGRVDNLHTSLDSDPPMSENVIFANILHINDINNALSGGGSQRVNAGSAATGFATSFLTGPLFSALNYGLEQTLHVEQVNIGFDSSGNPSLELRKQYGHNMYAMFRQSFSVPPQQAYGMVYTVRNNFEIDFEERQNPQGLLGQGLSLPPQETLFRVTQEFDARHVTRPKPRPTPAPSSQHRR